MTDTLTNITKAIAQGAFDSIKGFAVVFYLDKEINKKLHSQISTENDSKTQTIKAKNKESTKPKNESKVLKRVLECCALNGGVFWLSIIIFEYGLLPGLNILFTWFFGQNSGTGTTIWSWMQPFLSLLFGMVWVLPLFVLSRIVNSLWFQDIADSAYKFRKGRPQLMPSISLFIADTLFSLVVQALFLVQSMIVRLLPINYIGCILCFVHMCLLYSLYSFEYKWFNMGWELHKRLTYIETNWPYFLGFGMPLAILTQLPNSHIVSGCVFAILFPFFILSGNEATPITNASDFPLKLFSPVVAISNAMVSKTVNTPMKQNVAAPSPIRPSVSNENTPLHRSYSNRSSPFSRSSPGNRTSNRSSISSQRSIS